MCTGASGRPGLGSPLDSGKIRTVVFCDANTLFGRVPLCAAHALCGDSLARRGVLQQAAGWAVLRRPVCEGVAGVVDRGCSDACTESMREGAVVMHCDT